MKQTDPATAVGILSVSAYLPPGRLRRATIAEANAWANPGLRARARGERTVCSQDEDSLTMAVAAGRSLARAHQPTQLLFASTTGPFADRQNATLIGEALNLPAQLRVSDIGGSQRCATAALLSALATPEQSLVIAAEHRRARPGSAQEMQIGDGAASLVTGSDNPLALFRGSFSVSVDFVDHYRDARADYDYALEERWVREEGHLGIIPDAIGQLLSRDKVPGEAIDRLIVCGPDQRTGQSIAQRCGIAPEAVSEDLVAHCGHTGAAHPLLLLARALEQAEPGDLLLLAAFGQGCDVLLFEATERVTTLRDRPPVQTQLDRRREEENYLRYLAHNGQIDIDWGMRAERDNRTAHAAFYRHRESVTAFVGARCQACDTPQFPRKPMCANPECRRAGHLVPERFADKTASVKSFTEDWLALSYNPPLMYGNVQFEGGGIATMEFTDFNPGELAVGTPLTMQFRIKDSDQRRGFKRYCWKAAPQDSTQPAPAADKLQEKG